MKESSLFSLLGPANLELSIYRSLYTVVLLKTHRDVCVENSSTLLYAIVSLMH